LSREFDLCRRSRGTIEALARTAYSPDIRAWLYRVAHLWCATTIGNILQVFVRDNNVEQALRALKKKMQREGIFREMKRRKAYEKPSERKTREKAEAVRRARKAARKLAQREGLIPMPKRREPAPRGARLPRSF
jgi:small subunit ribosomal protein S21